MCFVMRGVVCGAIGKSLLEACWGQVGDLWRSFLALLGVVWAVMGGIVGVAWEFVGVWGGMLGACGAHVCPKLGFAGFLAPRGPPTWIQVGGMLGPSWGFVATLM